MDVKQTIGLKELIYIPEEGVCVPICDLYKCVFTVRSAAHSHGRSCLGIKRNMRKRHQGGEGAGDRLEKARWFLQLGLS